MALHDTALEMNLGFRFPAKESWDVLGRKEEVMEVLAPVVVAAVDGGRREAIIWSDGTITVMKIKGLPLL